MKLTLPYPPSTNRYWRSFVPRGATRAITTLSAEAVDYKATVRSIAMAHGLRKLMGPVDLTLTLHPHEPNDAAMRARKFGPQWHEMVRCLDVDNCVKVAVDALNGLAYSDDRQVWTLLVSRGLPVPGGALVVEIEPLPADHTYPDAPRADLLSAPGNSINPTAEAA